MCVSLNVGRAERVSVTVSALTVPLLIFGFQDAGDGSLATNLFVRKARIGSFRKYSLIAENAVGKTVYGVHLHRGEDHDTRAPITTQLYRPFHCGDPVARCASANQSIRLPRACDIQNG